MAITTELIKQLREQTGAGMMECKKALEQSDGDLNRAVGWLQERGLLAAAKKASREAKDGIIEVYAHPGNRLGVMVEVNCETDFVARMPEFRELAHDIALQIASNSPTYIRKEDIPAEEIAQQMEKFRQEAIAEGKKPEIAERIANGRMEKFYQEHVLLEQSFVKDDSVKMKDLITAAIAKIGENIVVRRFTRYQLGE